MSFIAPALNPLNKCKVDCTAVRLCTIYGRCDPDTEMSESREQPTGRAAVTIVEIVVYNESDLPKKEMKLSRSATYTEEENKCELLQNESAPLLSGKYDEDTAGGICEERIENKPAIKTEKNIEKGEGGKITNTSKESDNQDTINLGFVQRGLERLGSSQNRAINCTITIAMVLAIVDASGDYGLAFLMYNRGFIKEALLVLASECLASLLAILHITRTWIRSQDRWQKILRETLFLLIFSPVMVIVTTVFWFVNRICDPTSLQDNRYHFYAKTSTVLHGTVEAPMQIVLMISFIIKGQVLEQKCT